MKRTFCIIWIQFYSRIFLELSMQRFAPDKRQLLRKDVLKCCICSENRHYCRPFGGQNSAFITRNFPLRTYIHDKRSNYRSIHVSEKSRQIIRWTSSDLTNMIDCDMVTIRYLTMKKFEIQEICSICSTFWFKNSWKYSIAHTRSSLSFHTTLNCRFFLRYRILQNILHIMA